MTCHYNGAGSGALNDYGRALFAAEISSRWLIPSSVSDEELAETSKFLVVQDLPYWVRPALKYRALSVQKQLASPNQPKEKWIPMQSEFHLALSADRDQNYLFVGSLTYNQRPKLFSTGLGVNKERDQWSTKEAYLRIKFSENLPWIYAGLMDKVFGLREVNHISFSRYYPGLTQYDQSLGGKAQWVSEKWETFAGFFTGNPEEEPKARAGGFSVLTEYEWASRRRIGFSFLSSKSELIERLALAFHPRWGFEGGKALSMEIGLVRDSQLTVASADPVLKGYSLVQSYIPLVRGYNLLLEAEWGRTDLLATSKEGINWSLGVLTFPFPRSELRATAIHSQVRAQFDRANRDEWTLMTQYHLSL
jgi:hypothetical protein